MGKDLRTTITQVGQRYVDDPIYVEVSKAKRLTLAVNTALLALRAKDSDAPRGPKIDPLIMALSHHERVSLRWMTPDGRGGVKPKYTSR